MTTRTTLGTLSITMVGMIALGLFAPQPAQANDAGRAIAGIIAGVLVYELLGDDQPRHRQYSGYYYETKRQPQRRGWSYQSERRGFWIGNRGPRHYTPPRRHYTPPRQWQPPRQGHGYRQQHRPSYRGGYNPGYGQGGRSRHTGRGGWGY